MAGRPIRTAILALATWAVLFAPGAAADGVAAGAGPVSADEVAAAVMAPTLGDDGGVLSRSCRDDTPSRPGPSTAGRLPGAAPGPSADRGTTIAGVGTPAGDDVEVRHAAPTRAPPPD